jgi:cytochrome c peroxidase
MTQKNISPAPISPWRRAVALMMAMLMLSAPVGARAPGRAGIDALVDAPDELAAQRANLPGNRILTSEPVFGLPGSPTVTGFDTAGKLDVTVAQDAVAGAPDGMLFGAPMYSASGELVVPLLGVVSDAQVNGRAAVPAARGNIGRVDLVPPLTSLKTVAIPPVAGLDAFIRDRQQAIALGKALFWEARVGSDGMACASCHFAAGADNRLKNQLSPGLKAGDPTFNRNFPAITANILKKMNSKERHKLKATATGGGGANYTLKPTDFPTFRLTDPLDRNSVVLFETNDVVSSQGTFAGDFTGLTAGGDEQCANRALDEFNVHGVLTRKVEPRNSPTVINSVFNFRNFWDGRANNVFNGSNMFGDRDPNAMVLDARSDGSVVPVRVALPNASLASQAVGPALSDFEMSCSGKTFKDLGRKLLPQRALAGQTVHAQDSVLAPHIAAGGKGLKSNYADLIKKAFHPRWWSGAGAFSGYTQMESNFALFWGLSIMLYESTLVSDEAPVDKFVGWAGTPANVKALSSQEQRGLLLFRGKASCMSCHKGAEFTGAATSLLRSGETNLAEHMFVGGGQLGLYDNGFYNIGVRPTAEDIGVGDADPWGNPLSFARQFVDLLRGKDAPDAFQIRPCLFAVLTDARECWTAPDPSSARTGVDGAFKTPTLRNVSLTQPYFHNGSRFTLEQVVEFYNRGGDRRGPEGNDTTGYSAPNAPGGGASNIHPNIRPLKLSKTEQADLVAFLRNGLTDRRVACELAPFDHPSLQLTNGHSGNTVAVREGKKAGLAQDDFIKLPAVGAKGRQTGHCLRHDDGTQVSAVP